MNNKASVVINVSQEKSLQLIGTAFIVEDIIAKVSNEYHKLLLLHKGRDEIRKDAAYLVQFSSASTYLVYSSGEKIQISSYPEII